MAKIIGILTMVVLMLAGCSKVNNKDTEEEMGKIKDEFEDMQATPRPTDASEAAEQQKPVAMPTELPPAGTDVPVQGGDEPMPTMEEGQLPEGMHLVEPSEYMFDESCGLDDYLLYRYWGWCSSYDDLYLSLLWFGDYIGEDGLYGELSAMVSDVLVVLDSYDQEERPDTGDGPDIEFVYDMVFDEELRVTAMSQGVAQKVFTVLFSSRGYINSIYEEESL